ncbi:hypothetical protein KUCAC02_010037, partial [Chaenocephalus aceratus]
RGSELINDTEEARCPLENPHLSTISATPNNKINVEPYMSVSPVRARGCQIYFRIARLPIGLRTNCQVARFAPPAADWTALQSRRTAREGREAGEEPPRPIKEALRLREWAGFPGIQGRYWLQDAVSPAEHGEEG